MEFAAREDEEHHAVVGEESDGEEHEEAHEPARSLEAVRQAQDAGSNYGDEDVGEGLEIGGQSWCLPQERSVLSRVGWKGIGRRPCFLGEHHCFSLQCSILSSQLLLHRIMFFFNLCYHYIRSRLDKILGYVERGQLAMAAMLFLTAPLLVFVLRFSIPFIYLFYFINWGVFSLFFSIFNK